MKRIIKRIIFAVIAILAAAVAYISVGSVSKPEVMEWGVTFSKKAAEGYGFPWKEVYLAVLDDLGVDNIRLPAYWDELQPDPDRLDFSALDFQIEEASKRNVKILLAVGRRMPRWPECHIPGWARELSEPDQQQALLDFLPLVIDRYKNNAQITMWQVENEFFLRNFGECPIADASLLDRELALVRSLDTRPIVVTDSGELGGWWGSLRRGDVFGTTMYRIIYNPTFGYVKYPFRPVYYLRRFLLYKPFVRAKKIINVELQAEPWAKTTLTNDPLDVQYESLSPDQFRRNIQYAIDSGISPSYLWGAEWWYYLKQTKGIDELWTTAKDLWSR